MEIRYILVIVWFTQQKTHGEETSENYFDATNHEKISSDSYKLLSLENEANINLTALPSSSSKRIRREPPFTIIKHKSILIKEVPKPRSRRRFSRPAYGPPNYKNGEPITFYKPQIATYEPSNGALHPSLKMENLRKINLGSASKPSGSYEKAIGFDVYDNSFKERPEYVIVGNGGEKINSEFVYIADDKNRGRLGYVLSGGDVRKGRTKYIIYDTDDKPETKIGSYSLNNTDHQVSEQLVASIAESFNFNRRPHPVYGVPKQPASAFGLKTLYDKDRYADDDRKSGTKNVDLIYAPEYNMKLVPPATDLQAPKDLPENFRSGFIGPSYLPPPDFHSSPKKHQEYNTTLKNEYNDRPREYSSPSIQFIQKEVFDNSRLPLEDTKKHPNFDYHKNSYDVPIYDPEPFDSITSTQELFPPNLSDIFNEETFSTISKGSTKIEVTLPKTLSKNDSKEGLALNDQDKPKISDSHTNQLSTFVNNLHSLSVSLDGISEAPAALIDELITTSTRKPRKKRRRTRVPNKKRHAIDISTLKKVLIESELNSETATATTPSEKSVQKGTTMSTNETKQNFVLLSSTNKPKKFYESQSWESTKLNKNDKSKIIEPKEVQVISIQKSRSHSYYDGTVAPNTVKQLRINNREAKPNENQVRNRTRKITAKEQSSLGGTRSLQKTHRVL